MYSSHVFERGEVTTVLVPSSEFGSWNAVFIVSTVQDTMYSTVLWLDLNMIIHMILSSIKFGSKPVLMAFKLLNLNIIFIPFY